MKEKKNERRKLQKLGGKFQTGPRTSSAEGLGLAPQTPWHPTSHFRMRTNAEMNSTAPSTAAMGITACVHRCTKQPWDVSHPGSASWHSAHDSRKKAERRMSKQPGHGWQCRVRPFRNFIHLFRTAVSQDAQATTLISPIIFTVTGDKPLVVTSESVH